MDVEAILGIDDCQYITRNSTITYTKGVARFDTPFKKFPPTFPCVSPSDALFTYIDELETFQEGVKSPVIPDRPQHQWYEDDGCHHFLTRFGHIKTKFLGKNFYHEQIAIFYEGPGLLHNRCEYIRDINLAKRRALRQYIHDLEMIIIDRQHASQIFQRWRKHLRRDQS